MKVNKLNIRKKENREKRNNEFKTDQKNKCDQIKNNDIKIINWNKFREK